MPTALLDTLKTSGSFTTDCIILFVLFLLFFFYGMYFGKSRIISYILAFYPALFLFDRFPFVTKMIVLHGEMLEMVNRIGVFLLFLIPINIIIGKYIFADSGYGRAPWLRIAGYALVCVVLVLVFSYSVVSLGPVYTFSSRVSDLFVTQNIFWWQVSPFVFMMFL